jgi:hypothetical protein
VHHGHLAEMKVGNFVKLSGPEMIIAHRLLKNSIDKHEYLLITEKLLQQVTDLTEAAEMEWARSSEEYASIGKVDYSFALLDKAKLKVPEPPTPQTYYHTDDTSYKLITIAADFLNSYMVMMNIPGRAQWMPNLRSVDQDMPDPFIGSIHHCIFEDHQSIISPLQMVSSDEEIIYAESCKIKEMDLSLVYEFIFKKTGNNTCSVAYRFMNAGESPLSQEEIIFLSKSMQQAIEKLKEYCEKT